MSLERPLARGGTRGSRFDLDTAIAYAKALSQYDLFWYEEPGDEVVNGDVSRWVPRNMTQRSTSQADLNVYLAHLNKGDKHGLTPLEQQLVADWSTKHPDTRITPLVRIGGETTAGYIVETHESGNTKEVTYDRNGNVLGQKGATERGLAPEADVLFAFGTTIASKLLATTRIAIEEVEVGAAAGKDAAAGATCRNRRRRPQARSTPMRRPIPAQATPRTSSTNAASRPTA